MIHVSKSHVARRRVFVSLLLASACSGGPASGDTEGTTATSTQATMGSPTTSTAGSTDPSTAGSTGPSTAGSTDPSAGTMGSTDSPVTTSGGSTTSEGMSTSSAGTASTSADESSTTGTTSSTGGTTGDSGGVVCVPEDVPDALAFTYSKTVDIGLGDVQASYYNIAAGELVFLSYQGQGKRVALDGTVLGDVTAPPQVTQVLDGATYDQVNQTALLLDQACNFAEVDALTMDVILLGKIDEAKFAIDVCGGVALGLDGHLYVASVLTDEVVVITRDLTTLVRRFKVDDDGIGNVDGISLIAGSENFLVLSTFDLMAAIFDPLGNPIVTGTKIGSGPPLVGADNPKIPDASLTVCANGHVWVCEGLANQKTGCYVYTPEVESDTCPCVLPQ
jgi:hypothetical protein